MHAVVLYNPSILINSYFSNKIRVKVTFIGQQNVKNILYHTTPAKRSKVVGEGRGVILKINVY